MKNIDDVKAEINKYVKLGDILRRTGQLRTDMDEEQFSCPFHGKDLKPSARYYKATDSCHCFFCHKSWDLYSFLMQRDTATFKEVINTLLKQYKIDLSKLPEAIVSAGSKSYVGKKEIGVNEEKLFIVKAGSMISGMKNKVEVEKYRRLVFAFLLLKYNTTDDMFREKALKLKEVLLRLNKETING
jgi:DNA primase